MSKQFSIATLLTIITAVAVLLPVMIWCFSAPEDLVTKVPKLHGKTDAAVLGTLGKPNQKYEFTMDDAVGEFRIELYNTYPPGAPNNKNVEIREWTWVYRHHRLTLWLHKPNGSWVVLDTCQYKNGIAF
ncbi:hypothetical protein OAU26_06265 [Mariniblastus sp.]|nr:hypothetical protein [Mariniblastus sp.]MDA7926164.1 hypothetical protein [Mariniblastus sp.]MDC3224521.1 hypothetical protein [Mariniblastus sp.]